MFGYIKPCVPELKVKEHECWKAAYCGLCRCLGRHICRDSSLTLSYDATFLALARIALTGESVAFGHTRCAAHPVKKRVIMEQNDSLRYAASVCALLAYHKLDDDLRDGDSPSGRRLLLPEMKRLRKKAGLPELDAALEARLTEQRAAEAANCSADAAAEISGAMLGDVFAFGLDGDSGSTKRVAYELGRRVGRWVYLTDAADDVEKDKKSGAFNPFAAGIDRESLAAALALERRSASAALDMIDFADPGIEAILRNVIELGMRSAEDNVLGGKTAKSHVKNG